MREGSERRTGKLRKSQFSRKDMKTLELQTRRLRTANDDDDDDDDDTHEDKRISITRRGCLSPFRLKATKHWAILNYQRSWKQRKSSNFLAMRVEELKRSRDSPRNRYLQESIHVEESFLLDHERFTNHQKTTKICKTIFTTAKGYNMNANQLTCLEAQTTTKLQTEFLCSVFETKLQMRRSERQAGSQAGRQAGGDPNQQHHIHQHNHHPIHINLVCLLITPTITSSIQNTVC